MTRRPVTPEDFAHVAGPFYHGTAALLGPGDALVPGHRSPYRPDLPLRHVYFSTLVATAAWGAELATALTGAAHRGHVYVVEPTGPFEDDPNVTDRKLPGNVTQSYRSLHPLRVLEEVPDWPGHPPDVVQTMLDGLARLRREGLDVIED